MDEKRFRLGIGKRRKRIIPRWCLEKTFKEQTNRESCTVIDTGSAIGRFLTPIIIWKSKAGHLCGWYRDSMKENYWYGYSSTGYNNTGITLEYLEKVFEPETKPKYISRTLKIICTILIYLIVIPINGGC